MYQVSYVTVKVHKGVDGILRNAVCRCAAEAEVLAKKRGPEEDPLAAQRFHDALYEACGVLWAS
jgi:hypothetical protein